MNRTFATTTFAVALLGVSACKGGAADAVKLIPDAATVIGGVDVGALYKSKMYTGMKDKVETGEGKEVLEAAKACNLGPDAWKNVVFGMGSEPDNMAMVFTVTGIGKKENLECISGKIKEKTEEQPWTMEEKDGKLVLTIDEGKAIGYVVDDNTIAVASKPWADSVKELIGGKGKPAVDNSLKDVYGKADTKKTIWVAGNIPADMVKGTPAEGATNATVAVDMTGGIALSANVGFDKAETAKAKADEVNKQFEGFKGMAGSMGVPQGIVDSVKVEAKDTSVALSAKATDEEVDKLTELAKGAM